MNDLQTPAKDCALFSKEINEGKRDGIVGKQGYFSNPGLMLDIRYGHQNTTRNSPGEMQVWHEHHSSPTKESEGQFRSCTPPSPKYAMKVLVRLDPDTTADTPSNMQMMLKVETPADTQSRQIHPLPITSISTLGTSQLGTESWDKESLCFCQKSHKGIFFLLNWAQSSPIPWHVPGVKSNIWDKHPPMRLEVWRQLTFLSGRGINKKGASVQRQQANDQMPVNSVWPKLLC